MHNPYKEMIWHFNLKFRIQEYLLVEGTDVDKLTDGELYGLLDAEDEKFIGQHG